MLEYAVLTFLCFSFQENQILQKAHGQRELAFSSTNGITQEAKRCVDMWLKMPGTFFFFFYLNQKPGVACLNVI